MSHQNYLAVASKGEIEVPPRTALSSPSIPLAFVKKPWEVLDEEVLPRLNVEAVFGGLQKLKKIGKEWSACCPFHNDSTPSFSINPHTLLWNCFGCNNGGNGVQFIMKQQSGTWMDAATELARRAGVDPKVLETWRESWTADHWKEYEDRSRKEKLLEELSAIGTEILLTPAGQPGVEFLASRSLSTAMCKDFQIGFYSSPAWANEVLQKRGYTTAEISNADLLNKNWSSRVIAPWRDRSGRIINIWGRTVIDAERKFNYLTGGKKSSPYCLDRVVGSDVIVVEGFFDAIHLQANGITNVVGLGGNIVTEDQAYALRGAGIKTATLNLDWDEGGVKGTQPSIINLRASGIRASVVDPRVKHRSEK